MKPTHLILIFVVGASTRCGWVLSQSSLRADASTLQYADERDYWQMAGNLADGRTMRDRTGLAASRMPAYPFYLSLCVRLPWPVASARMGQALIGALGCLIFARLGERCAGPKAGLLAGILTGLDPFAIQFCGLLLSETLFTVALGLFVLCMLRLDGDNRAEEAARERKGRLLGVLGRWCAWGISFLVCLYLHPSAALLLPVAGLIEVLRHRSRQAVSGLGLALMIAALGVLPWTLRNQRVLGGPCLMTTRLGISLFDGVGPRATGRSDLAYTQDLRDAQGLTELEWNKFFTQRSLEQIKSDPWRIGTLAVRKFVLTWNVFPNVAEHRSVLKMFISAAWMIPCLLLACRGAWSMRKQPRTWIALLVPVTYFTLIHMVFVGSVRYRVPMMPMVEVLSSAGWVLAGSRFLRPTRAAKKD